MKKIGIQTILDCNFGNRLQNYALQTVLEEMGYDVQTLNDISETCLIQRVKNKIKYVVSKDYRMKAKSERNPYSKERGKIFDSWDKENIKYSRIKISRYHVPLNFGKQYDYFITGSDQVWNPFFRKDSLMLLSFSPPSKRISYAASFGVNEMPEEYVEKFRRELMQFKAISVREESGVNIVKKIANRDSVCVLDPTMLLTIEQWKKVERKPEWLDTSDYIILYSLGGIPKTVYEFVNEIARCHGLKVYQIFKKDDRNLYLITPFEFVYLIDNARFVVTDSFHGTVFSILGKTPFVVFDRVDFHESMKSRFQTLLSKFKFEGRKYREGISYEEVINCDFSETDAVLNAARNYAINYLLDSLK